MIKGKYGEAVVPIGNLNPGATAQFFDLLNTKMVDKESVVLFPVIDNNPFMGYTQTYHEGPIDPDIFGNSLGNGVLYRKFKKNVIDINNLSSKIKNGLELDYAHKLIIYKSFKKYLKDKLERARSIWPECLDYKSLNEIEKVIESFIKRLGISTSSFIKSFCEIGSKDVFYIGEDDSKNFWITLATNESNIKLELKLNNYWRKRINKVRYKKEQLVSLEKEVKKNYKGNNNKIVKVIKRIHDENKNTIFPDRFIIDRTELKLYLQDLFISLYYFKFNRREILNRLIVSKHKGELIKEIESINTYIDPIDKIIRVGSIKAINNKDLVIIGRDNKIIIGKGNDDSKLNYSLPYNIDNIDLIKDKILDLSILTPKIIVN